MCSPRLLAFRPAEVLGPPAIPLFGTMDLMRGSLEPLAHRGIRIGHPDDHFLPVPLPAHGAAAPPTDAKPMRSRICRA